MQQCLNCGRELTADAIARGYCPSCGAPVTAQPASPPAAQTPPAYPQYTPPAQGGYGQQPTYSQPLAYQGQPTPDQPQTPQQPTYSQPLTPDQSQQPPAYPPTGTPPAYPQASTPYPGQQYPPSSYQGQPTGDAAPGYPPGYPQPSMPYQPGVTGAYPQQPGTGAYPQQPGTGAYPQQPGTGAYPQQQGTGAYPPPQGTGAYPSGAYPGYAPTLPPPAKSGNNNTIIGLVVALVIVVLLAGGLFIAGKSGSGPLASAFATATPAATNTPVPTSTPVATATPTVPSGFTAFTAPDGSYSIDYPSDWAKSSLGGGEEFTSTDLDIALVLPTGQAATAANLQAFFQGANATNVQVASATTSVSAGGNTWTAISGTGNLSGEAISVVFYSTQKNGQTSDFITLAPTSSASTDNTTYFQPMLQSLTFK